MSDVRDPDRDQQLPVGNDTEPIHQLVANDLIERMRHGTRKYGQPLQAFNGRKAVQDLYEELLDATVYVRQMMEEDHERMARHLDSIADIYGDQSGLIDAKSVARFLRMCAQGLKEGRASF